MRTLPLAESRLLRDYEARTPTSAKLSAVAKDIFPSGVTHDVRFLTPYPIFVERAQGSRKWDVDGNEYVDYFGGHGALILGHNHAEVVDAVQRQAARGVHFGSSHELELEWAQLVCKMLPCARKLRFTVTGTEATHLALRLARAYTGKPKILRFATHFHGWHDHVAFSGGCPPAGILQELVDGVIVHPLDDIDGVWRLCRERDDIAALILEPTGSTFGQVPLSPSFLLQAREVTAERGIVLIFDEVITGFRCSPAGAQGFYGVTPDLATLAKILGGGYPAAAVAGCNEIFETMQYVSPGGILRPPAVPHQGTYNAGPVSAAAGLATLRMIESSPVTEVASRTTAALRDGMNDALRRLGAPWCVYGEFSGFHIFLNPERRPVTSEDIYAGRIPWGELKSGVPLELLHKIRVGFLCGGVDIVTWPGGTVSAAHSANDLDRTIEAFERLVRTLAEEGNFEG